MDSANLNLRAVDADRERVAQMLREAAGDGALSLDELDERLSAAYAAVTRADLVPLVSDLPPGRRTEMPLAPIAEPHAGTSLFWVWGLVPIVGAGAWVHAAFLTGSARYWTLAAIYTPPLLLALITAPEQEDQLPGWVTAIVVAFWIVNAIHAWTERSSVDRQRRRRA